ncbi:uncharacterized protein B4U79_11400 [Dinothrombium tinctorium]|uniref:Uncharacterized protein n=1 Tax=Dinothrombium tinctorium TaxID=1965070 RepID=A0A443QMP3_9ACAR|nr:uncharacterized protein B4U79_11400 [Dinothrombium tinctorium]
MNWGNQNMWVAVLTGAIGAIIPSPHLRFIMSRSFTITLPSNVTSFQDNTMAAFRTILPKKITLDGDWEVGLAEISYTKSWFNLSENQEISLYTKDGIVGQTRGIITAGSYDKLETLIEAINISLKTFSPLLKKVPKLLHVSHSKRVILTTGEDSKGNKVFVKLGASLENILGFKGNGQDFHYFVESNDVMVEVNLYGERDDFSASIVEAKRPYDLSAGIHSLFVYSDIVEPTFVGDTYAQLLRTVKIPRVDFGEQCVITMDEFYIDQAGNGYPFFAGIRYQRGHGWFGRLFKGGVLPLLRYVGKKALKTGSNVVRDVLQGDDLGSSAKKHLKTAVHEAADDAFEKITQRGKGIKRKGSDKIIHGLSSIALLSELDLFSVPPTQLSIEKSVETEHRPTSTLNATSFIEFDIPTSFDEYILLSETYLYMKVRIHLKKSGSEKITGADWSSVIPANYFLHSLFKVVELSYNGKEITRAPQSYAYRAYIEALLGYSEEAKKTHLTSALWFNDSDKRSVLFHPKGADKEKGAIVDMMGKLHTDLAFQGKALIGGSNLKLKLVLNPTEFFLQVANGLQAQLEIVEATLLVHRLKATQSLIDAHRKALNIAPTKYPITRCEVKQANITKGVLDAMIDDVCLGILLRRIFVACVKNYAFNG